MDPAPRVGVVDDQDERAGPVRGAGPGEVGRTVLAVAGEALRDRAAGLEGGRGEGEVGHRGLRGGGLGGRRRHRGRRKVRGRRRRGGGRCRLACNGRGAGDEPAASGAVGDAPGAAEHPATASSATSAGIAISRWVAEPRMRRSSTLNRNRAGPSADRTAAPTAPAGQTAPVKPGSSPFGRHPSAAGPSSGRPNACQRRTTWKPRPSYSWSAPVGFDASTPEPGLLHPVVPQDRERGRAQRLGDALAPPLTADRDVVEPAALDPELLVLLGVDPVHDRSGDLVAVPGHAPQRRVGLRVLEARPEVAVVRLAMAPVVAEGLVVGVEDRPVLVRRDRTQLEPGRQRAVRKLAGDEPPHLEPEPDRDEALVAQQRLVRPLDVERPRPEGPLAGARIAAASAARRARVARWSAVPMPWCRCSGRTAPHPSSESEVPRWMRHPKASPIISPSSSAIRRSRPMSNQDAGS